MKPALFLLLVLVLFTASCDQTPQDLVLHPLFQDNLVMQQDKPFQVWGNSMPGTEVTLSGSWGESASGTAGEGGNWTVSIPPAPAGGPYEVTVSVKGKEIVLQNVLSGEVWLASGQSNMEMPLKGWPPNDTINYSAQEVAAANFPEIRMITVERAISEQPLTGFQGNWRKCTPENAMDFSATAYFFARKVHQELGVPVGIIHTSWGGTPAEAWVSAAGLRELGDFNSELDKLEELAANRDATQAWLNSLEKSSIDREDMTSVDLGDEALKEIAHDDSAWPLMSLPAMWESQDIGGFDGVIWFRKTVTLDAVPEEAMELHLGPIDDMDVTYVNGQVVGETLEAGKYQVPRVYSVPAEILNEGENVISVKVFDGGGGGGIYAGEMRLGDIPLDGEWRYMPTGEYRNGQLLHLGTDGEAYASRPPVFLDPNRPSVLYNAMIHPVINYSFKGAIWYQGESNVGRAEQYEKLFPSLINDWRRLAGEAFPFYFVQIAPFAYGDGTGAQSAALRDAQRKTLSLENTGMVVTMDIGNVQNIHPGNKQDVGARLALNALANTYDLDTLQYSGPLPSRVTVQDAELHISFNHAEGGLVMNDGGEIEIAGEDGIFYPADLTIQENSVILTSSFVAAPLHARYAWKDVTDAYLFNNDGLPASSFSVSVPD